MSAIRNARIEGNLRSDQLFHTEVADPRDNKLFQEIAELAVPKLVDFGLLPESYLRQAGLTILGPVPKNREPVRELVTVSG